MVSTWTLSCVYAIVNALEWQEKDVKDSSKIVFFVAAVIIMLFLVVSTVIILLEVRRHKRQNTGVNWKIYTGKYYRKQEENENSFSQYCNGYLVNSVMVTKLMFCVLYLNNSSE